jgi:hypothetical protein
MSSALPSETPDSPRSWRLLIVLAQIRNLAEACVRRRTFADIAFARAVRWILERCLPYKTGQFVGSRVGYNPDNHNARCLRYATYPKRKTDRHATTPSDKRAGSTGTPSQAGVHAAPGKPGSSAANAKGSTSETGNSPKPDRRLSGPKPSAKKDGQSRSARANAGSFSSKVGVDNERRLASKLGSEYKWIPGSGPVDLTTIDRNDVEHGIEVKTLLTNKRGTIHMTPKQMKRKVAWVRGRLSGIKNPNGKPDPSYNPTSKRRLHVAVIDHREAYYDSVYRKTDFGKRKLDRLYYARKPKSLAIKDMIGVKSVSDLERLKALSDDEYKAISAKFAGRMYPSGKPQPIVNRIVGSESLTQIRHLHRERTKQYIAAMKLLHWRQQNVPNLTRQIEAAKSRIQTASSAKQKREATTDLVKLEVELIATNFEIDISRARVAVRKQKLARTKAQLRLKQAERRRKQ